MKSGAVIAAICAVFAIAMIVITMFDTGSVSFEGAIMAFIGAILAGIYVELRRLNDSRSKVEDIK